MPHTPQDYFARQIALWGEARQESLQDTSIAIIGCGGLGTSLAMALGGSGIGTIHLVDFDTVELHNIHRQIAFELTDLGRPKAEATAQRIRARNPFVSVEAFVMDFATFGAQDRSYDLLLDATDNHPVRAQIDRWASQRHIPWIYGSVEAFHGQVCVFDQAAFGVLPSGGDAAPGIAAPMVMHVASLQANLALRILSGLPVVRDKLYYLFFDEAGELIRQTFGLPKA